MSAPVPAGWYPQENGTRRYWDGTRWTGHVGPAIPAPDRIQPGSVEPAFNRDDPRWDQPEFGQPILPGQPGPAKNPASKRKRLVIPAAVIVALGVIVGLLAIGVLNFRGGTVQAAPPEPVPSAGPTSTSGSPTTAAPRPESEPASSLPVPVAGADYAVSIDSAHFTHDSDGRKAIVVDFSFSNNSDEVTSFLWAVERRAFQNGVELDDAYVSDDRKYDSGSVMKEVKPGATQHGVQWAWTLDDDSDVTIEVEENNALIATREFQVK